MSKWYYVLYILFLKHCIVKVECLMYTFHGVGRQAEDFLTEDQDRLKDFRQRLQYLAR